MEDADIEVDFPDEHEDEAENQEEVDEEEAKQDAAWHARSRDVSAAAAVAAEQLAGVADQEQVDLEAQLPHGGVDNPFEADAPDPGRVTAAEIRAIVRQEVQRLAPQETVLNNLKVRYLFAVFGIIGAVNATFALIKASGGAHAALEEEAFEAAGEGQAPAEPKVAAASGGFPALDTPEANAVVAAWRLGDDETAFWALFGNYVTQNAPRSFPEQLLFMQFTENLAYRLMPSVWQWASAQDKVDLVKTLSASISSSGLAATYILLPTLTYQGRALPRAIAANLMSFALADWSRSRTADDR